MRRNNALEKVNAEGNNRNGGRKKGTPQIKRQVKEELARMALENLPDFFKRLDRLPDDKNVRAWIAILPYVVSKHTEEINPEGGFTIHISRAAAPKAKPEIVEAEIIDADADTGSSTAA